MGKRHRRLDRLLCQKFFPVSQLPSVPLFAPGMKPCTQRAFGTKTPNTDNSRFRSHRYSLKETAPSRHLDLFDMRHVEKNRIAQLQVLLDNRVERLVKMRAQLFVRSAVSRMGEKSIDNVVVVKINDR
jgi:hypothetical protein